MFEWHKLIGTIFLAASNVCVCVYVGVRVSVRLCGGYVFVSICAQTAYSTHKALRHAYNLSDRKY